MAGAAAANWPTFGDFTFDLSERLRDAARTSLAELEASINRDGYDWLEDYIDNIQAQDRRAPIADLIKTPSRTATAKQTRGVTTAQKTRQEQIRLFNAQLSPLAAKSPDVMGRMPFSPLQVHSLNTLLQSPTPRSPLAPKGAAADVLKASAPATGKAKAAPKSAKNTSSKEKPEPKKRGRPKKNGDSLKENDPESVPTTPSSRQLRGPALKPPPTALASPSPLKRVVAAPMSPSPVKRPSTVLSTRKATATPVKQRSPLKEISIPAPEPEDIEIDEEVEPEQGFEEAEPIEIDELDEEEEEEEEDIEVTLPVFAPTPSKLPIKITSPLTIKKSPVKHAVPVKQASPVKQSSPAKAASPVKSSSPAKAAAAAVPSVPTRQVRSSWLSQALGTRTVPITNGESSSAGAYRKSYASQEALRKSTASGALKRKSSHGPDAVIDDEDVADKHADKDSKRAEKMARFDENEPSPTRTSTFASRAPGSATSLPAPHMATTPAASSTRYTATSVPQETRARHDKMARALDDLRERTAAAAAAKQKATSTASRNAPPAPMATATSTGAGFLRGLGTLSAGIFGVSAEDEAARVRRDADDRRAQEQAEAELARIMRDMAEEERKAIAKEAALNPVPVSESVDDDVDMAVVVDEEEGKEDDYDELNESISLPDLPEPDFGDDYDALPVEEGPASALGARGIDIDFESTTPPNSPPPRSIRQPTSIRAPEILVSPPPKAKATVAKSSTKVMTAPVRTKFQPVRPPTASSNEDDEDEDEDLLNDDMPVNPKNQRSRLMSSTSTASTATASTMSRSSTGILTQAERMAAKSLGVKPATGAVKSIQRAAEAAKKEQATAQRKAQLREQIERRRLEEKERKDREERVAAEEERKRKAAAAEERRRRLAEAEKNRKEREERMDRIQKEKAAREEREAAEAAAKAAEEEASRKRKMAVSINKTPSAMKRIGQPAAASATKGKEPLRIAKSTTNLAASASVSAAGSKLGPTSFRTADEHRTPTIQLVNPSGSSRPLGPPSRTSQATATHGASSSVLAQSRMTLQAQLDAKATEMASEDIVLPDIASEYSDSDDSEHETDFKRPAWAESPELRAALENQAHVNPDELFGTIRPLNMDELFKARQGKFRARTSSANWSGADRLTEQEEREYARRMGFKPINAPREGGGSAGDR